MARENRLCGEKSPYLQRHAKHPVDWYPWGEEAWNVAQQRDCPVFLSIGYSACHWCHKMEEQCFQNADVAYYLNKYFVSIKVDKEERPDLDEVYMTAAQTLTQGRAGWPLTLFLTKNAEPFFAGSFFPLEDSEKLPGFKSLLRDVSRFWQNNQDQLLKEAQNLKDQLNRRACKNYTSPLSYQWMYKATSSLQDVYDSSWGGFYQEPKFPWVAALDFLSYRALEGKSDALRAKSMLQRTLEKMALGGIYDHLQGGFFRYAVDRKWQVPHFEKMLVDNALIAVVYLKAHQLWPQFFYRSIAENIFKFLLCKMCREQGGFYASLDADSQGKEGAHYLWDYQEIQTHLNTDQWQVFSRCYALEKEGNWQGVNILYQRESPKKSEHALLNQAKETLLKEREKRSLPCCDHKIITSWNALTLSALCYAHRVLHQEIYLKQARKLAFFLFKYLRQEDGQYFRYYIDGSVCKKAHLEDYAFLANAYLDYYELSFDDLFLKESLNICRLMLDAFYCSEQHCFQSVSKHEKPLFFSYRFGEDSSYPNPNAQAALAFLRIQTHFPHVNFHPFAQGALIAHGQKMHTSPRDFLSYWRPLAYLLQGPLVCTPSGEFKDEKTRNLLRSLREKYIPNLVITKQMDFLDKKSKQQEKKALYICTDKLCLASLDNDQDLTKTLESISSREKQQYSVVGELIQGFAHEKKTQNFCEKSPQQARKVPTDWTCLFSGIELSNFRRKNPEAYLKKLLLSHCNVIFTSSKDEEVQHHLGSLLSSLIAKKQIERSQYVICLKIAWLSKEDVKQVQAREESGSFYFPMRQLSSGKRHCLDPRYLENTLAKSQLSLQIATLDGVLLEDPEVFFLEGKKTSIEVQNEEFEDCLYKAFCFLEEACRQKRVQYYGVSTRKLTMEPLSSKEALSLPQLLKVAKKVSGDKVHFRLLACVVNLLESENICNGPLFKEIQKNELVLWAQRPLRYRGGQGEIALEDIELKKSRFEIAVLLQELKELEAIWRRELIGSVREEKLRSSLDHLFEYADLLFNFSEKASSLGFWNEKERQIFNHLLEVINLLDGAVGVELKERWLSWKKQYLDKIQAVFFELRVLSSIFQHKLITRIHRVLDPFLQKDRRMEALWKKALYVIFNTPHIHGVVAPWKEEHLDALSAFAESEPLKDLFHIYQVLHQEFKGKT